MSDPVRVAVDDTEESPDIELSCERMLARVYKLFACIMAGIIIAGVAAVGFGAWRLFGR